MRIFWKILGFAFVMLLFDTLFSYLSTCDPQSHPNPYNQSREEYCSAFRGPFVSLVRFGLVQTGHLLHDSAEAVIAAFTIVLAISTIALWRSTEKLFQAGERQIGATEKAAEAALLSARVSAGVERPFLYIKNPTITFEGQSANSSFRVVNLGRTPAIVEMIFYRLRPYPNGLPKDIGTLRFRTEIRDKFYLTTGEETGLFESRLADLESSPNVGKGNVFLLIYVVYEDVFGNRRSAHFCYGWGKSHPRIQRGDNPIRVGGPNFNYDRVDREGDGGK
jgi:hypothetical protein